MHILGLFGCPWSHNYYNSAESAGVNLLKTWILILSGFSLVVAYSCSNEGGGFLAKLLKGGGSAVPVTVESVVVEERNQLIRVPVVLEAAEAVDVTLPEDVTIDRSAVAEGDTVNAGATLFRISEQEITTRLGRLRSELRDAQNNLDKSSYLLRNRDRLLEEGRMDKAQYDSLELEMQRAETGVEKVKAELAKTEEKVGSNVVTAPSAGVVAKLYGTTGTTISAGKPLATITRMDVVNAVFKLLSGNANYVKQGQTINIRLTDASQDNLSANIVSIGTEINPQDDTFTVKATLMNGGLKFKLGMRGEALLTGPEKQRVYIVPEEAIIRDRRAYFVYTIIKGVAHRVQVIPSQTIGNKVEIVRGIKDDDLVVVKGQDKLVEGTHVDIWGK